MRCVSDVHELQPGIGEEGQLRVIGRIKLSYLRERGCTVFECDRDTVDRIWCCKRSIWKRMEGVVGEVVSLVGHVCEGEVVWFGDVFGGYCDGVSFFA